MRHVRTPGWTYLQVHAFGIRSQALSPTPAGAAAAEAAAAAGVAAFTTTAVAPDSTTTFVVAAGCVAATVGATVLLIAVPVFLSAAALACTLEAAARPPSTFPDFAAFVSALPLFAKFFACAAAP
jgi:hypothetical protein